MHIKRFQPYQGRDGDYQSLLNFAKPAAQILSPGFDPPKALLAQEDTEGKQALMRFYKRWGNAQQGFESTHTVELEPKADGAAVDRVELRAIGLPDGCRLEIECAREWYDPRFIELRVAGPQVAAVQVLADFEATFGSTRLDPANARMALVSAQVSLNVGATAAALMKAEMVLDIESENVEALLIKAKAQQTLGRTAEARRTVANLLQIDSGNVEALRLASEMSAE